MAILQFNYDSTKLNVGVIMSGHRLTLTFPTKMTRIKEIISKGFVELNENNGKVMSDFSDYKYLYHTETEQYVFTITNEEDDEYIPQPDPPEPEPEPEPYVPTLDEVKAEKINEIQSVQETIIENGVTVELTSGTTETFTLSTEDQSSLTNLRLIAAADLTNEKIPWHSADGSQCKYYSAVDIIKITDAAIAHVTYNVTLFNDLRIYINSLTTKQEVKAIEFDISYLPYKYYSEVLKDLVESENEDTTSEE